MFHVKHQGGEAVSTLPLGIRTLAFRRSAFGVSHLQRSNLGHFVSSGFRQRLRLRLHPGLYVDAYGVVESSGSFQLLVHPQAEDLQILN